VGAGTGKSRTAVMPCNVKDYAIAFLVLQNTPCDLPLCAHVSPTQIPTVALLMGERGLVSRVLAPKYTPLPSFTALSSCPPLPLP